MRIDENFHCQFKERKSFVNVKIEYVYDVSISYVRDIVFRDDFNRQEHFYWRLSCQLIYLHSCILYFFLHYCALDHYVSICAKFVDDFYYALLLWWWIYAKNFNSQWFSRQWVFFFKMYDRFMMFYVNLIEHNITSRFLARWFSVSNRKLKRLWCNKQFTFRRCCS